MALECPHRRYHREATHYRCLGDGETECPHTLPLGEAETVHEPTRLDVIGEEAAKEMVRR